MQTRDLLGKLGLIERMIKRRTKENVYRSGPDIDTPRYKFAIGEPDVERRLLVPENYLNDQNGDEIKRNVSDYVDRIVAAKPGTELVVPWLGRRSSHG